MLDHNRRRFLALLASSSCLLFAPRGARAFEGLAPFRGSSKPGFTLPDLDGGPHALAEAKGHPVLVHFFATWCEPCQVELPAIQRLYERVVPGQFSLLAISVGESPNRVRGFMQRRGLSLPVLLDYDQSVSDAWNVTAFPTSYVLDSALVPRLYVEQDHDWDSVDLPSLIRRLDDDSSGTTSARNGPIRMDPIA